MMPNKEKIRLAMLRALAFVTFPPDLTKLKPEAKILLIRPDHLGDILFTTPALRTLREALPDAKITYMVGPWSQEVVAHNPNVDEVRVCQFPGFARRRKINPVAPYYYLRRQARSLRPLQFDVAVDLRFDFWWGAMLAYFANIPHRIGYATPETKPFLTLALPYVKGRHEVLQNLRLAEAVARLVGSSGPRSFDSETGNKLAFYPQAEDDRFAGDWLTSHAAGSPVALLHAGTGAAVKLWRPEGFARVADALSEKFGLKVILSGAKSEEPLVTGIAQQMSHEPGRLIGASVGQLASVLGRCRLAVGVDSGVMHLAAAMGTPTVRLYGPVDEATFGPWGENARHIVVKSGMDCIPCNRLDFKPGDLASHPCVRDIEVEQVLAAVEQLLRSNG